MKWLGDAQRQKTLVWLLLCVLLSVATFFVIRLFSGDLTEMAFDLFGRKVEFENPELLWLLALLPLLLFGVVRSYVELPWEQRVLSFLLRSALFVVLLLGLSKPAAVETSTKVCVVGMVDVSTSVSDDSLEKFRAKFKEVLAAKRPDDEVRLLAFAQGVAEVPLESAAGDVPSVPSRSDLRKLDSGGATNVSGALEAAPAYLGSDCLGRYLIYSDGIETRENALAEISEARARGVRVSTDLLSEEPPADAAVIGLELPPGVRTGEPFELRVQLTATREAKGQLRLYQGETLSGLGGVRVVTLPKGQHYETFESVVRVPGDVTYRAEFVPEGQDAYRENNEYSSSIEVPGPPRVLIVERETSQATYLAQALLAQQLDVDVRAPAAIPQTAAEMAPFHFVILSDLSRADVTRGSEALLEQYVRGGGGLLYSGGEAAYGPGGWQGSRLEKILPVTMQSQKEREVPGVAMALVIDRSGSMTGLPLSMAKEACNATVGVLDPHDLIEIIAFDSRPTRFVKMQPARYRSRIESAVATILPGGGTEIFESLDMAYQDLSVTEARKKHIILLTDGNSGSDGIFELASAAFAEGITITTVGLGGGVNRELLTMISEAGGGRFHLAEDPSRLPRIFTRETELISKKAAISDWFPVSMVKKADFLDGVGIGAAPLLRGYTSTELAPPPAELILASDQAEPILARRPVGLGYTLAWTSDLKARWATDWLKWATFGRFMAQLVREHQKSDDTEIRPMEVAVVGDEVVATLDAYDALDNFENRLDSTLLVRRLRTQKEASQGNAAEDPEGAQVAFSHVAPGLYQARAPLPDFGTYTVKAEHRRTGDDGKSVPAGVSFASVTRPYPEEFMDLSPRPSVLREWATAGQGQFSPAAATLYEASGDLKKTRVGRQNDFIYLALLLFVLDLFVRRVRLFDRDFRRAAA